MMMIFSCSYYPYAAIWAQVVKLHKSIFNRITTEGLELDVPHVFSISHTEEVELFSQRKTVRNL